MNNTQSTISSKNQIVVPAAIRRALKLNPGDTINWRLLKTGENPKAIAEPEPKNWAKHTRGLGQDLWQDTNIESYINTLRSEWQTQD